MLYLPEQASAVSSGLEKIKTYLTLARLGCPVFRSALIAPNERISHLMIQQLRAYFESEEVTVRYQYIRPIQAPIRGGNRCALLPEPLSALQNEDTLLWVLEPVDRLKNEYGINLHFYYDECTIEIVGKGFDVSDLNRGDISPHETITTELPIRMGVYYEWWKFLKFSFPSRSSYESSMNIRLKKLAKMGYSVSPEIFESEYSPLPKEKLEELLAYITAIHRFLGNDDYCVSCSVIDSHFTFWDIQTPKGKKIAYGVN